MTYHLAQLNVARALAELDDPLMHGFVSRLDEINALADRAPGFVWRLQTEAGDATSLRLFDDPLVIVNLSVWKDTETLKAYVYKSLHVEVFKERKKWFEHFGKPHLAMWWVPGGHTPTVAEAQEKLEHLTRHGSTPQAFNFGKPFSQPDSAEYASSGSH